MKKRNLFQDVYNTSIFNAGGKNHQFFSQAESEADVTIDLDALHIDDRSDEAVYAFEEYVLQVIHLIRIGVSESKVENHLEGFARAALLRFDNDKKNNRVLVEDEKYFFYRIMAGINQSCLYFGVKWFVPFLIKTGLIDIVGIADIYNQSYYIDWCAFAARAENNELLLELLSAGFSPKDHDAIGISSEDVLTDNTTTVVYQYSGYCAAILERCGFPANNINNISTKHLHWMNDISYYPGEDAAGLRANYLAILLKVWFRPGAKEEPLETLSNLDKTPLLTSITCADTIKAMRAHSNVCVFIAKLLVEFRDLVLSGAHEGSTLPHWLTPEKDKPFVRVGDTKAYGVLVLDDSTEDHRSLIKNLIWRLDAYVIGLSPENGEPDLVHINKSTNKVELDALPPTFPDELFTPLNDEAIGSEN